LTGWGWWGKRAMAYGVWCMTYGPPPEGREGGLAGRRGGILPESSRAVSFLHLHARTHARTHPSSSWNVASVRVLCFCRRRYDPVYFWGEGGGSRGRRGSRGREGSGVTALVVVTSCKRMWGRADETRERERGYTCMALI
jgi:hypothetical protein